jgi:hypothetical protein
MSSSIFRGEGSNKCNENNNLYIYIFSLFFLSEENTAKACGCGTQFPFNENLNYPLCSSIKHYTQIQNVAKLLNVWLKFEDFAPFLLNSVE